MIAPEQSRDTFGFKLQIFIKDSTYQNITKCLMESYNGVFQLTETDCTEYIHTKLLNSLREEFLGMDYIHTISLTTINKQYFILSINDIECYVLTFTPNRVIHYICNDTFACPACEGIEPYMQGDPAEVGEPGSAEYAQAVMYGVYGFCKVCDGKGVLE